MRKSIVVLASILAISPSFAYAATVKQAKPAVASPRPEYNIRNLKPLGGDEQAALDFDRSIIRERQTVPNTPPSSAASTPPPPPSPGLQIGNTMYDYQHNSSQGYQVGRSPGSDVVHFTWMAFDPIFCQHECERFVAYNSYSISTNTLNQGSGGQFISLSSLARSGYTNLSVDAGNRAHITMHQREDPAGPYNPWHLYFPIPGNVIHQDSGLGGYAAGGCPEVFWPKIAASRDSGGAVHIIALSNTNDCPTDLLWYWRFNGTIWTGPVIVDSTGLVSYALADDPTSDKMAVVVHDGEYSATAGFNNVAYLESTTDGAGWIAGTEPISRNFITNYVDPGGPQAWLHLTTAYDNSGTLHFVWDEQRLADSSGEAAIRHWNSSRQTVRTVALGDWPTPFSPGVNNLNLAKITLGIGDGGTTCGGETNEDYLYVLYTRFAGPSVAEQADHSVLGFYNGELYLNSSNDGGLSWSPPRNLTNTKTPNCNPGPAEFEVPPRPDSVCRSEHWATIGQTVSDIDIFFISDKDAGGIPLGEGTWQLNPVMYLRLPGGTPNATYVCPNFGPQYASAFDIQSGICGTEAALGDSIATSLSIGNFGNSALSGQVSVVYTNPSSPPSQWLTVDNAQSAAISIPVGGADIDLLVVLNSIGLPRGLFEAEIHVAHNDTTQGGSEVFPIAINVAPCACHADPVCDGAVNVQDVISVVARAFRGIDESVDPGCPVAPPAIDGITDVDCSGATDAVDVVKMVDVAFRGADQAVTYCSPCAL